MTAPSGISYRSRHAAVLGVLLGLFCFRVFAQLLQAFYPVLLLPPFDAWQSGALRYGNLVATQFAIIFVYGAVTWQVASGRARSSPRFGKALLGLGTIYFGFMVGRLLLGLTAFDGHSWWDQSIPSLFHLVLASFLLTAGHFYVRPPEDTQA